MVTRILIELNKLDLYRVTLADGSGLVSSTRLPFLDGARALKARGVTGRLEMWDKTRPYPRMVGDIAKAAGLSIEENRGKAEFVRYKARPSADLGRDSPV